MKMIRVNFFQIDELEKGIRFRLSAGITICQESRRPNKKTISKAKKAQGTKSAKWERGAFSRLLSQIENP